MPGGAGGYAVSYKRSRDAGLVTPLDELRATDFGTLTSWGGAITSGALYTHSSGIDSYLVQIMLTPFSGAVGAVQLLDGTTVASIPIIPIPQASGAVGTQIIPMANQRFLSGINVQTVSGLTLAVPGAGVTPLYAGAIQAIVMVDPKAPEEG